MSWNAMMMALAVASADPHLGRDGTSMEVTSADAEAIRMLVRAQIAAFRAGNARRAWELASNASRQAFDGPEDLLRAVRRAYPSLSDARQIFFGDIVITPDGLGQLLELVDQDGDTWRALYLVGQDASGEWVAHGCLFGSAEQMAA